METKPWIPQQFLCHLMNKGGSIVIPGCFTDSRPGLFTVPEQAWAPPRSIGPSILQLKHKRTLQQENDPLQNRRERSLQENDKESNQHFGKTKTWSRLKSHRNVVVGLNIGKPCNKNPKCYQTSLQWSNEPKRLHSKVKTFNANYRAAIITDMLLHQLLNLNFFFTLERTMWEDFCSWFTLNKHQKLELLIDSRSTPL